VLGTATHADPLQTLNKEGVTLVSYQVVPVVGEAGAEPLAAGAATAVQPRPLYTFSVAGALVSYQRSPVTGVAGGLVLAGLGKV
jgi:hypothetical protein